MKPAGPGGNRTGCILHFVSLLLLFCITQLLWALVWFHGQFISSAQAAISPFDFCLRRQDDILVCDDHNNDPGDASRVETNVNIARVMVILSLYIPLVLVPFSLMALRFALRCEEGGLLWFSVASQAASSLLLLLGITAFMALHWAYVSLAGVTVEFYVCVSVCVKLAIAAGLSWRAGRRLAVTDALSEPGEDY